MQKHLLGFGLCLCVGTLLYSDESMSQRMQSVVDEVSELRDRYERVVQKNSACVDQLKEQQSVMQKISREQGYDYELFEKNRERLRVLEAENIELKNRPANNSDDVKKKFDALLKENKRLQSEREKDEQKYRQLQTQYDTLSREHDNLHAKNNALESRLQSSSKSTGTLSSPQKRVEGFKQTALVSPASDECNVKKITLPCKDDNPFPQLMMKEEKIILPHTEEAKMIVELKKTPSVDETLKRVVTEKGSVYRMNKEVTIYEAPSGKPIEVWEKMRSFTSNVFEGEWIKITGFFVNRKWQKAKNEMWVKAEDTLKR